MSGVGSRRSSYYGGQFTTFVEMHHFVTYDSVGFLFVGKVIEPSLTRS